MASVTAEQIRTALSRVTDSESGQDVVSAGMISGIVIKDGNVGFAIEVDPERGPRLEPLRKACEETVHALPGVLSVTAVLTAHADSPAEAPARSPAAAASGPAAAAPRQGRGGQQIALPGVRAIIAVASGKGGVGKSTTAVNLALGLKTLGLRVGLLDADIYGPSIPRLMGLSGRPESDGEKLEPMRAWGISCMSIGFLVDEDTPMIWRGPMVMSALEQMMRDVRWGELDVMVIDLPPGTGDAQLTMAQRVPVTGSIIVSTPQDIALIDARKGLAMFRKVEVPVFGIVENMSYFLCPSCGERSEIFGHGGARQTAERLDCDFLGEIPLHMAIRETSDGGAPIVASQPDSPFAKAYLDVAVEVARRIDDALGAGARKAPSIVFE